MIIVALSTFHRLGIYLYYDVKIRFHSCFVAYFLEINC